MGVRWGGEHGGELVEPAYGGSRSRGGGSGRSRFLAVLAFVLSLAVGFASSTLYLNHAGKSLGLRGGGSAGTAVTPIVVATHTATPPPFDPSVGAPLPTNRIVAMYGIVGGVDFNGPASTMDLLQANLPTFQQLGKQYAALDPTHPVQLGLDLVVNVLQPCYAFPQWCASWPDDATIQAYITFCKQHNLLLFFDVQLGTEPVADAVTKHLDQYLEKYPFAELALDTEFHFPNTPQGYADAEGYPYYLGWMNASEINWAIQHLAQMALTDRLPRKVLLVHQWNPAVLPDKSGVKLNSNVSLVLQSDGFGGVPGKLGDYQVFVQSALWQYGGYKLFFTYQDDPNGARDIPLQTPAQVMQIFPQPLFISYQ
jgi:hypothetical protein